MQRAELEAFAWCVAPRTLRDEVANVRHQHVAAEPPDKRVLRYWPAVGERWGVTSSTQGVRVLATRKPSLGFRLSMLAQSRAAARRNVGPV